MIVTTSRVGTGQTWNVMAGFLGMASRVGAAELARQMQNCANNC